MKSEPRSHRRLPPPTAVAFTAMALLLPAIAGADLWYEHYQRGNEALQQQAWGTAAEDLTAAIALREEPAVPARLYGMKTIDYLPYYKLGIAYLNLGSYQAAIQAFETELSFGVISSVPVELANLEKLQGLARSALAEARPEQATAPDETPGVDVPNGVEELLDEAVFLVGQGRLEEAAVVYGRVLSLDPTNVRATEGLSGVQDQIRTEDEVRRRRRRAAELAIEAEDLVERDELTEALGRLDRSVFLDPKPEVKKLRDAVRGRLRRESAREDGAESLESARALAAQGRSEEALRALQPLVGSGAGEEALALHRQILEALAHEESERSEAKEIAAWLGQGRDLVEGGQYEPALVLLNRVLAADRDQPEARSLLRKAYLSLNRRVQEVLGLETSLPPSIAVARHSAGTEGGDSGAVTESTEREFELSMVILDDEPELELTLVREDPHGRADWATVPEVLAGEPFGRLWVYRPFRVVPLVAGESILRVLVTDRDGLQAEVRVPVRYRPVWIRAAWWAGGLGLVSLLAVGQAIGRREVRRRRLYRRRFNPYIAGPPVLDDALFFGREELIGRVLQTIHNNSILLYGERRIGKTSLLHVLQRRLRELDDPEFLFVPAYIDLQGTPEEQFFDSVSRQIFSELSLSTPPQPARSTGSADGFYELVRNVRDLLRQLQRESDRRVKLVLLVDEVDELNHYDPRTNQRLRSLFMKSFAENLVAVFAGVAIRHSWERDGSPWYNFFEELEVRPLDRDEAIALVERPLRGTLKLGEGVAELLVEVCFQRPYRIQKMCVAMVQQAHDRNRRVIELEDIERLLRRGLEPVAEVSAA